MNIARALSAGVLLLGAGVLGGLAYHIWGPRPAPPADTASVRLTDLDGQPHTLAEWRGELVLVNFWASWCSPCRREIPMLIEVQDQFRDRGFRILGPAMDRPDTARDLAARLGIDYPVFAGDSEIVTAMTALGDQLGALPYSVLIGRDGRILEQRSGELHRDELVPLIERHL